MNRVLPVCLLTVVMLAGLPSGARTIRASRPPKPVRAARAVPVAPGVVTIDASAGHPSNVVLPRWALGIGVDGLWKGDVARFYTPANLRAIYSAGFQRMSYRLRTELGVEAWHWNPSGNWSDAARRKGYWTSSARPGAPIDVSYGYRLPRRGNTVDQANDDGYSRIDDGDSATFWKSNPYLDRHFTHESEALHPQWISIDLGRRQPVQAIRILWGRPRALRYRVEYWQDEPGHPNQGLDDTTATRRWTAFPNGAVNRNGPPDGSLMRLADAPVTARLVRIVMTESSHEAPPHASDVRDRLGYAVREVFLGTLDARGQFQDAIRHGHGSHRQTPIVTSSTDPWHRPGDLDPGVEQPGFDRIYRSGLGRGNPVLMPVGVLYDTPENAAAEIRYLKARGYPVDRVEMGEEPDGQFVSPEDYGALYVQFADALHRVSPTLQLGGPGFQTDTGGWTFWPDETGENAWMRRFLRYLGRRGHSGDFDFFSFEWYPFDDVCGSVPTQLAEAPRLLSRLVRRLRDDGVPGTVPWMITEYGYSALACEPEVDLPGAIMDADLVAHFLTLGGDSTFFYGDVPSELMRETEVCDTWGNLTMFVGDEKGKIRFPVPAYYAMRLLTQRWAHPADVPLSIYPARGSLRDARGNPLVTAYALRLPKGGWSVLLLNKDPVRSFQIALRVLHPSGSTALTGPGEMDQYSPAQYAWQAAGRNGHPLRNRPPVRARLPRRLSYVRLPAYSITIVRTAAPP